MKQVLFVISIFLILSSCGVTRKQNLTENQKTVKFKETGGSNYLSPNFQRFTDTTYVISLLVRTRIEPTSEIVTEKLNEVDRAVLELENSLARNNFRVIDRAIYHDQEAANINIAYPFDLILEIAELQTTRYSTGIILTRQYPSFKKIKNRQYPHYLEGRKMLVKIVNAKNGEIAALVNSEYVPCRNGCKLIYNNYEIIETTTISGKETKENDPEKLQYSNYITTQLTRQVSDFIKIKMYKYNRNLQPE